MLEGILIQYQAKRLQPGTANASRFVDPVALVNVRNFLYPAARVKAGGYSIRNQAKQVLLGIRIQPFLMALGLIHCQHGANASQGERLKAF